MEWAVFFARAIMLRADCVSHGDIHLLREILARCGRDMAETALRKDTKAG